MFVPEDLGPHCLPQAGEIAIPEGLLLESPGNQPVAHLSESGAPLQQGRGPPPKALSSPKEKPHEPGRSSGHCTRNDSWSCVSLSAALCMLGKSHLKTAFDWASSADHWMIWNQGKISSWRPNSSSNSSSLLFAAPAPMAWRPSSARDPPPSCATPAL
eukprot:CAMPEP_0204232854 /NCGR_PEP_ID=MMETSP0361-20130328/89746_1 /ASSEMBLY_ACC=CAM_ASM_000343 /TAXON_ID=268821 /ORGANISM="Scrippsiella Hangoei, Strain SHTV-5" /LENGTH=157 /DNA_ID=CAMNT_0051202981 /DNA_START=106 /DNA_END=580 /DNA_ORIENTATION=+